MKYFLLHPDANRYDPPGVDCVKQCPGRVEKMEEADVIFVCEARFDGFKFDDSLNNISKPWALFSWSEFGWDNPLYTSYLWGKDRLSHSAFQSPEWEKFDKFVRDNPPKMVFQRELLKSDVTEKVQPLDYLNWLPVYGNDTKDEYLSRPLDISFNFGRSHESRMWFHGAVFQNAGRFGYDVVSEFSHVEKELTGKGRKWLSVHSPHYARIDAREVQKINRKALITVVLEGAGKKTFRLGECCADGVMAIPINGLAMAYPWTCENSIQLWPLESPEYAVNAVKSISDALMDRDRLYEVYCAAMENSLNYQPVDYMRRHVAERVKNHL